jgi:hypothetical protein
MPIDRRNPLQARVSSYSQAAVAKHSPQSKRWSPLMYGHKKSQPEIRPAPINPITKLQFTSFSRKEFSQLLKIPAIAENMNNYLHKNSFPCRKYSEDPFHLLLPEEETATQTGSDGGCSAGKPS